MDNLATGYVDWWGFVPDILGCINRGYGPAELGTTVNIVSGQEEHPILKGIKNLDGYHSSGSLYLVAPLLHNKTNILMKGITDEKVEPIAWTRTTNYEGRVFYTSLGHPADFKDNDFLQLLKNVTQLLIK